MARFCPAIRPVDGGNIDEKFCYIRDNFARLFNENLGELVSIIEPWFGFLHDAQLNLSPIEDAD